MKKTYIEPQMKVCFYDMESILDATGVTGDNGTGYGGVDEEGEKDPDANSSSLWEDEYSTKKDVFFSTIWDSL